MNDIKRYQLRYFLEMAYKGTNYHGWQVQKNAHSVQQELNNALFKLFRTEITTMGSGRTDKGVHAEQQYVQLDVVDELTSDHIFKLNHILPCDMSINNFFKVKENANVRYDATSRVYEYRISRVKNPFLTDMVCFYSKELDVDKMNLASKILLNHKDFEAFSKVNSSARHYLCDILKAEWIFRDNLLIFEIEANRFLRGMVRAIVGTMLDIGLGRKSLEDFEKIIQSRDREEAGRSAPASGLFLVKVNYPSSVFQNIILFFFIIQSFNLSDFI
jgi:tRNA pseudouridine38-40 synthase